MRIGGLARLMLAAALGSGFLAGCGNFWQAPGTSSSFTLSNSGNITVAQGSSGTATITVTPGSSFTGTVTLTCAVAGPSGVSSSLFPTCALSPTSVSITSTATQASTLNATIGSSTPSGAYNITVTGASGSISPSPTTVVCVAVGTGTCTSTAGTSGKFYILNASSIAGYTAGTNTLTPISGSSYTVSGLPYSVAIAPSGNFLYVAGTGGITLYTISSTGALTPGSVVFGDYLAQAIQVDPSGKWLLEASSAGSLIAYPITTGGAQDTSRSIQTMPLYASTVNQIAIAPNGSLIAVALGNTGTEAFPFTSGNASPIGTAYSKIITPFGGGSGAALSVAIDPQNRLLYVGETNAFPSSSTNSGGLRVYTIGSGSLTELGSSPYASGGLAPHFILPVASGSYVYVGNGMGATAAGNITEFAVSATALTLGTSVATGAQPASLAEDSTGTYVLEVGSSSSSYLGAYTFSSTTGSLTSQVTSTATSSVAVVAAPK